MHKYEALIRRYFDACNAADHAALLACFTPNAVHYFPPGLPEIPWRSADTIAKKWIWCVEHLGSQWTIEKVLVSPDSQRLISQRQEHTSGVLRGTASDGVPLTDHAEDQSSYSVMGA